MLYFKINGFFTTKSTKEAGFTLAPKQEWKEHESGREFSIVSVDEMIKLGDDVVPVEGGISVRYLWRNVGSKVSHKAGYQFAQRAPIEVPTKELSAV